MSVVPRTVLVYALLLGCSAAWGDMAYGPNDRASDALPAAGSPTGEADILSDTTASFPMITAETEADWLIRGGAPDSADAKVLTPLVDAPQPGPQQEQRVGLPAIPSSLSLGVSALASLGLTQVGRSFRKCSLHFVPDWYHAGGPQQIGYATAFDLDSDWQLTACPLSAQFRFRSVLARLDRLLEVVTAPPALASPRRIETRGPPSHC